MRAAASQRLLSVAIADAAMLHRAAMPFVVGGGIFLPTEDRYRLGEEVFLLLRLPGEDAGTPVAGKVVWVTPQLAGQTAGIGVQLQGADDGLRRRLREGVAASEDLLGEQQTYTM